MKLKVNDTVKIMVGRDKGKVGKILKVIPGKRMVLVENVNQFKRHLKARLQGQKSEIVLITRPIFASKVALYDAKSKKTTRVGISVAKDGKKVRVAKKKGVVIS